MSIEKRCPKCKTTKSISEFYKCAGKRPDGYKAICKSCEKEYVHANPDIKRRTQKKYRESHRDVLREKNRIYEAENPEKGREKLRRARLKNPEKYKLYVENRRARISKNGGIITPEQWQGALEFYGNKCLCCGRDERITLDHVVPIALGGKNVIENAQPLCHSCNSRKNKRIIDYRNNLIYTGM